MANLVSQAPITKYSGGIEAGSVLSTLKKYILADGFELVLDLERSHGRHLVDAKTGKAYLDFFSFFASNALGMNHPKLQTAEFREKLHWASMNKPSNSDIFTQEMAEFVQTFGTVAKPDHFKYLFFVEGGSVAVENGLKVAFDWKVRKNFAKGYKEERGTKVIHFKEAFHGRTGYTLSLTNTDPTKIKYFPKFDWPRITTPKIIWPLENNLETVLALEEQAIREIKAAIKDNPDDIAVIIIEPVQAEGGDNHFRPDFFRQLRAIADEHDILLMFDEVQTGLGITGKWWASEHYVMPDIVSFGKKVQVCGIMVSSRVDEVEHNCFHESSRINSTWGGNLADMVRATRILEVMQEDNIIDYAAEMGRYLQSKLRELQQDFPKHISNTRGLGMMCAFDLPSPEFRKELLGRLYEQQLMILGCGHHSVRFRTALTITREEIDFGLKIIKDNLSLMTK